MTTPKAIATSAGGGIVLKVLRRCRKETILKSEGVSEVRRWTFTVKASSVALYKDSDRRVLAMAKSLRSPELRHQRVDAAVVRSSVCDPECDAAKAECRVRLSGGKRD